MLAYILQNFGAAADLKFRLSQLNALQPRSRYASKSWMKKANNSISLESQIQPGLRVNPALPGFEAAPLAAPLWGFGHRLASQISQRGSRGIGGEQQEQYKQTN